MYLNASKQVRFACRGGPRQRAIALAAVCLLANSSTALAVKFWKNSVPSGNWSVANSWSATGPSGSDFAGVPGLNEPVRIYNTNGAAHTVTLDISPPALGLLSIDLPAAGALQNTLLISTNNALTAAGIWIGGYNGTGATTGNGALGQSAGTISTSSGSDLVLAYNSGSTGVYSLSGGSLNVSQSEHIGLNGTATFNHSGGTNTIVLNAAGSFILGTGTGSNGTYNLSGTGQLISHNDEHIGYDGIGIFNQTGGSNTIDSGDQLYLGVISGQGTYNLSGGTLTATTSEVVGNLGVGQFTQTGGNNTTPSLVIAAGASGQGAYAISGGTLTVSNNAVVGQAGTGSMNITLNGVVNIANNLSINNASNVTLNGGTLRFGTITNPSRLIFQSGTLQLSGNRNLGFDSLTNQLFGTNTTIPTGKRLIVEGEAILGLGTANITGGGLTSLGALRVGYNDGTGAILNITGGATVTSGEAWIADNDASSSLLVLGTANVSGAGSTWNTGPLVIGRDGRGALNITAGGTVNSSGITLGFHNIGGDSSYDTLVVSGPGSSISSAADLRVGFNAEASVSITDGARVSVSNELYLAPSALVTVDGGTLRFNSLFRTPTDPADLGKLIFTAGTIQLGGNRNVGSDPVVQELYGSLPVIPFGKGLTIEGATTLSKPLKIDGGTLKTNGLSIGAGGSLLFQSGVLEITGGTFSGITQLNIPTNGELRATGTQTIRVVGAAGSTITATGNLLIGNNTAFNGFATQGTLNVGANLVSLLDANDAVLDATSYTTLGSGGSPGTLDSFYGITLNFGGNITGYGTISTLGDITTPLINNGHIIGTSAAQRITLPGYVKGVGTFDNVTFTGTFSPGLSPTTSVVGSIALSTSSTLQIEVGGFAPGTQHDQIQASGAVSLAGVLNITPINGFQILPGDEFTVLKFTSRSGDFSSMTFTGNAFAGLRLTRLFTSNSMIVKGDGLKGDADLNGVVDFNDLLALAQHYNTSGATWFTGDFNRSGTVDFNDLLALAQNYGGSLLIVDNASAAFNADWRIAQSMVPEPSTTVALFGCVATSIRSRRRSANRHES